jgi:ApaG protein
MYREMTDPIQVQVEVLPAYVEERSNPALGYYFFAYQIKIKNLGEKKLRLTDRHWIIRDGNGIEEHVKGPGVVGEKPELNPGQEFQYTSFCPLRTPTGNMRGIYKMIDDDGHAYDIRIPLFFLRHPSTFRSTIH